MLKILKKFYRKTRDSLAVDVGTSYIKIAGIKIISRVPVITTLHKLSTPAAVFSNGLDVKALAGVLKKAVKECGWENKKVVSAVWADKVITRHIKVPAMPAKELQKAVRWEAEKFIPVPLKNLIIEFLPLGDIKEAGNNSAGYQHLLLVAVYSDVVYKYHNAFEQAGLQLEALDLQALALWCLFCRDAGLINNRVPASSNTLAVADIGASTTHIVFIKNGLFKYTRTFPAGGEVLQDNLLSSGVENLATELRLSLDYYRTQEKASFVEKLFLTGGKSKAEGLPGLLSRELDLPVETLALNSGNRNVDPDFALATGLALRKVIDNV